MTKRHDFAITQVTTDSGLVRGDFDPETGWTISYRFQKKHGNKTADFAMKVKGNPRSYRDAYDIIEGLDAILIERQRHVNAMERLNVKVQEFAYADREFDPSNDEHPPCQVQ
jgi:hypothetical protein